MDDNQLRERAREIWGEDWLEIDRDAKISHAEDGCWVAAWVWVCVDGSNEEDE